jgi:hypothetical protein
MPMPPPKASTESPRDRQVFHEMGQIVRALEAQGPQRLEDLARLVGAPYWEAGRFDRALALAVADGLVVESPDGRWRAS